MWSDDGGTDDGTDDEEERQIERAIAASLAGAEEANHADAEESTTTDSENAAEIAAHLPDRSARHDLSPVQPLLLLRAVCARRMVKLPCPLCRRPTRALERAYFA